MNQPTLTAEDSTRLQGQSKRIRANADGVWRSLKEWADLAGGAESGTSARLREVANQYGYVKEKKNLGGGVWLYRILPPPIQTFEYDQSGQAVFL